MEAEPKLAWMSHTAFIHEGTITTEPTFVHEDIPTHSATQQEEDPKWAQIWSPHHSPLHLGSLDLLHTIEKLFTTTSSKQQSHQIETPGEAPQQSATKEQYVLFHKEFPMQPILKEIQVDQRI